MINDGLTSKTPPGCIESLDQGSGHAKTESQSKLTGGRAGVCLRNTPLVAFAARGPYMLEPRHRQ